MNRLYLIFRSSGTKASLAGRPLRASTLAEVLVTMVVSGVLMFALYEGIVSLTGMFRKAESGGFHEEMSSLEAFDVLRMRSDSLALTAEGVVAFRNGLPADTLALDYPDPFLRPLSRPLPPAKSSRQHTPAPSQEAVPSPDFTFKGIIGSGSGTTKAMIVRGGELLMLVRGERVGQFDVLSYSPEILTLGWKGRRIELKSR